MLYIRSVRAGALALLLSLVPALAQGAETLREAFTSAYLNNPDILSALLNVKATAEGIAVAKRVLDHMGRPSSAAAAATLPRTSAAARPLE